MGNTVNVCLGHLPFPEEFHHHVDVMIAPRPVDTRAKVVVAEDAYHGPNGHMLSEYAQILWLADHFGDIVGNAEFVRLFQYRRFCSSVRRGVQSTNQTWSWVIQQEELRFFEPEFSRSSSAELFNHTYEYPGGVLGQYANAHHFEDILLFAQFLTAERIMHPSEVAELLGRPLLIPACNIGLFRSRHLRELLPMLTDAGRFRDSPLCVPRTGPQRRSVGFLLERLLSHLIQDRVGRGRFDNRIGNNIVISETVHVAMLPNDPFIQA